jgi:hypothetical protein
VAVPQKWPASELLLDHAQTKKWMGRARPWEFKFPFAENAGATRKVSTPPFCAIYVARLLFSIWIDKGRHCDSSRRL